MSDHAQNNAYSLAHFGESVSCGTRALEAFRFARQQGSHRSYVKAGVLRPVVIPAYDEVPVAIIHNNLKTAGISREEYFHLIEEAR